MSVFGACEPTSPIDDFNDRICVCKRYVHVCRHTHNILRPRVPALCMMSISERAHIMTVVLAALQRVIFSSSIRSIAVKRCLHSCDMFAKFKSGR